MSLILEANIVNFPEDRPGIRKDENKEEWTDEVKRKFFQQESEIHLLKLGPVDQDLLDSKLIHMDLKGVNFNWNKETKEYRWDSGDKLAALPHKYLIHLLEELKKVGFDKPDSYYSPDQTSFFNGEKQFWRLEKKF